MSMKTEWSNVSFYYHPVFLEHLVGVQHPESPERLKSILSHLQKKRIYDKLDVRMPNTPDIFWLEKIHPKDLKSRLAKSIVTDFWGKKEAERAAEEFEKVFKHKEVPSEVEDIEIRIKEKMKVADYLLIDLLVEQNIFSSRGEAKRMIRQGGIYLEGQRVADLDLKVNLLKEEGLILKIGKRKFYRLKAKQ